MSNEVTNTPARNAPACPSCDGKGYNDNPNRDMSPLYCFDCEGTGREGAGATHTTRYYRDGVLVDEWQTAG